jgi:hypothetical protein
MKILFICRDLYYYSYPPVAEVMSRNYNAETYAVVFSTKAESIIRKKHPAVFREIFNMDDFFARNGDFRSFPHDEKIVYLERIQERLRIPSLFSLFYVDRLLQRYTYDDAITIMYGIARFIEDFYDAGFDLFVGEIGTFFDCLLWNFVSQRNGLYVFVTTARIKGKIILIEANQGDVFGLKARYEHLKKTGLQPEDEELFEDFYQQFASGKRRPEYTEKMELVLKAANLLSVYRERANVANKSKYALESIDRSSILQFILLRLKRFFNKVLFYPLGGGFSRQCPSRYIYYPLHVDPEISTMLYGPYYVNQVALVQNIAKSIPMGYMLVVKEHPYMYGLRDSSFYREITKLPNVILLHPMEDNYSVVKNADAVIVVTGTAGLEGIFFEKPVFTLGEVFFSVYDYVYRIDNIKSMAEVLRDGMARFQKDPECLKKFTVAYLKSSYNGVVGNVLENRDLLDHSNTEDIAAAIKAFHETHG